ncbi:hypothetical protein BIFDEN_01057 [Bifidobacterium dentium ATCC 27678]|nr:hypothetical protein BIFDEN_01057 [Bifidobacterium dentium ATCC 27678]
MAVLRFRTHFWRDTDCLIVLPPLRNYQLRDNHAVDINLF